MFGRAVKTSRGSEMTGVNLRWVRWLCGGLMASAGCMCTAQTTLRKLPLIKISPELSAQGFAQNALVALPTNSVVYPGLNEYAPHSVLPGTASNLSQVPNGCAHNQASLCFDYRTGHAVYKPLRQLLPAIPGMSPHNLSIRRDKILAEYSFK